MILLFAVSYLQTMQKRSTYYTGDELISGLLTGYPVSSTVVCAQDAFSRQARAPPISAREISPELDPSSARAPSELRFGRPARQLLIYLLTEFFAPKAAYLTWVDPATKGRPWTHICLRLKSS